MKPARQPLDFMSAAKGALAAVVASLGLSNAAEANTVAFDTPANSSTGGQSVSAHATFTTSNNTITILLDNEQANQRNIVQSISELTFTITTGQRSGQLTSSSALERTVHGNKTYTDGAMVATGWALTTGSRFELDVLGTSVGPAHTLIGPSDGSLYSHANGSMAGNRSNNAFLTGTASFTLHVPGVTSASSIRDVSFNFGTTPDCNVVCAGPAQSVPEPSSWALATMAGVGMLARGARRRMKLQANRGQPFGLGLSYRRR